MRCSSPREISRHHWKSKIKLTLKLQIQNSLQMFVSNFHLEISLCIIEKHNDSQPLNKSGKKWPDRIVESFIQKYNVKHEAGEGKLDRKSNGIKKGSTSIGGIDNKEKDWLKNTYR